MNEEIIKKNLIVRLSFEFGLEIIDYIEKLESDRKYVIANQLLKSATSIGANIWEAQNAESKNDFVHKIKISAKEVEETHYWLLLCMHSKAYPDCVSLVDKLKSINKIVNKIISTTKQKRIS